MRTCPNCHRELAEDVAVCTYCGALLMAVGTTVLDDIDNEESVSRWGTARFNGRTQLVIAVRGYSDAMFFDPEEVHELLIGRIDPESGESPAIDLQAYGASELGVSRRHAALIRRDGALSIMDKGTPNGTYLNGQRLIPLQPRILRDGDEIRLGRLVLNVTFRRTVDHPR